MVKFTVIKVKGVTETVVKRVRDLTLVATPEELVTKAEKVFKEYGETAKKFDYSAKYFVEIAVCENVQVYPRVQ